MSSITLKRVEREPLWDQAQGQLRDALFAGRFEPGRRLTLRELAETFGTSITPVRDAVTRLIAQGVLEQGPRNSAVVPDIGVDTLRHLTIVRSELEGRAAREAALRATHAGIGELERQLERMRGLIESRKLEAYLDAHRRFHFGIYKMAAMPVLLEIIESLWLRCGPVLSFVVPEYVLSLKGTDHHVAVLAAIRARDGLRAETEIAADIEEASRFLESLAGRDGRIRRKQLALP